MIYREDMGWHSWVHVGLGARARWASSIKLELLGMSWLFELCRDPG